LSNLPTTGDVLLEEQLAYYRAASQEFEHHAIFEPDASGHTAAGFEALNAFGVTGDVLEFACGPGTWTKFLVRHAASVTALDGAPEMLARAKAQVADDRVRFIQADLFKWTPDRRYDVVFFAFWLSHVPLDHFESFWKLVEGCLKPTGRVFFVDDAYRAPEELIEGEGSSTIQRRLNDGTAYRAVKVPHQPAQLEERLAQLGWRIRVVPTTRFFYWGAGACARTEGA
jgi:demethylmenaquinone methyltransferase/2-methoxy-6-polyprenyl-1,4-benzoquinol methylase